MLLVDGQTTFVPDDHLIDCENNERIESILVLVTIQSGHYFACQNEKKLRHKAPQKNRKIANKMRSCKAERKTVYPSLQPNKISK